MPRLHLTKVAFACASVETLERRIASRSRNGEVRIATRFRPRRADELIGGSLYWIVKHRLVAAQPILRFDERKDGRVDIVCSDAIKAIVPVPKRAHQGWRYFEEDEAAQEDESGLGEIPPRLYGKLAALALV